MLVTIILGIVAVVENKFAELIKPVFNKVAVVIPVLAFTVPVETLVAVAFARADNSVALKLPDTSKV